MPYCRTLRHKHDNMTLINIFTILQYRPCDKRHDNTDNNQPANDDYLLKGD